MPNVLSSRGKKALAWVVQFIPLGTCVVPAYRPQPGSHPFFVVEGNTVIVQIRPRVVLQIDGKQSWASVEIGHVQAFSKKKDALVVAKKSEAELFAALRNSSPAVRS